MNKTLKLVVDSLLISIIGVFGVDYFSHLFFSNPMETLPYFFAKMTMYFVFSLVFLATMDLKKKQFLKVLIGGIIVSSLWGIYYNVLPEIFEFYPFGIALKGLTFLGMGVFGTGLAFGTVHTIAFIVGYYIKNLIIK
jgi:hypothetical protein